MAYFAHVSADVVLDYWFEWTLFSKPHTSTVFLPCEFDSGLSTNRFWRSSDHTHYMDTASLLCQFAGVPSDKYFEKNIFLLTSHQYCILRSLFTLLNLRSFILVLFSLPIFSCHMIYFLGPRYKIRYSCYYTTIKFSNVWINFLCYKLKSTHVYFGYQGLF